MLAYIYDTYRYRINRQFTCIRGAFSALLHWCGNAQIEPNTPAIILIWTTPNRDWTATASMQQHIALHTIPYANQYPNPKKFRLSNNESKADALDPNRQRLRQTNSSEPNKKCSIHKPWCDKDNKSHTTSTMAYQSAAIYLHFGYSRVQHRRCCHPFISVTTMKMCIRQRHTTRTQTRCCWLYTAIIAGCSLTAIVVYSLTYIAPRCF